MTVPRSPIQWNGRPGPNGPGERERPPSVASGAKPGETLPDLEQRVRSLERRKRAFDRSTVAAHAATRGAPFPGYYERATIVSFRLDGLQVTESEVAAALARGAANRACRSRSSQRVRNHVAALRQVEALLARGRQLESGHVVRWYTSVACGLSYGHIDGQTAARIGQVCSTMNSPQLRLGPAVREIAALHVRLLADPFVPGFNGIVARLLLRYHLGRCGLPPVLFHPEADAANLASEAALLPRLLDLILESYEATAAARS
jgi:hypothetical protein